MMREKNIDIMCFICNQRTEKDDCAYNDLSSDQLKS